MRLPPRYTARIIVATVVATIAALALAALVDPPISPAAAAWVRWLNVTTGAVAFLGLLAIVTPRWSTYAPPFRDAIGVLLIYLFVAVGGSGRALLLDSPFNEFYAATAFANLGALRILYRAVNGEYAGTLRSRPAPAQPAD
jgi:hypothetical protein